MRLIFTTLLACAIIISLSCSLWSAETSFDTTVRQFITVVTSKDRTALAGLVSYPLQRSVPLPSINDRKQFLEAYDEIVDEQILKAISTSRVPADWSDMGGRGIMFQNGSLWLDEEGRITAINYQTEKGKRKLAELIEADKQRLHVSVRDFIHPVLEWKTAKFRIRIDRIADSEFRYSAWPVTRKTSEKPDLVLRHGSITYEGSGGNHHYDFNNGSYNYRCIVNVISADKEPPGELEVTERDTVVVQQPVIKVITGR